jgi:hypothetical protein
LLLLVTLVALLGIGALTLVAVRPTAQPAQARHHEEALHAAESGVQAALAWLGHGCEREAFPAHPPHPALYGNGFEPTAPLAYDVTIEDAGAGLRVRAIGRHGRAEVALEVDVEDPGCPGEPSLADAVEVAP